MATNLHRYRPTRNATEWLILALVLLVTGVYFVVDLRAHRAEIVVEERERLSMHVLAVERMLLRQLAATDAAITSVIEDLPAWRTQHDGYLQANRRLQVLSAALDGVRNILVTDRQGRVIASNKSDSIGRDLTERPAFQSARRGANPNRLYVAAPFVSRNAGYVLSFNRVIAGPQGEFDGVVIAGADPEYFTTLLESVRYAPEVQVSIIHGDGVFFMATPPRPDLNGVNLMAEPSSLYAQFRHSGVNAGIVSGVTRAGEHRMAAFRSVQSSSLRMDKDLVVAVSRDLRSIYAPWYREALIDASLFVVLMLGSLTSLAVYQRRRSAYAALAQQHELARQKSEADLRSHTRTLELLSASMLQHREDEKARLAVDLHEGVAQTLSVIKLNLESVAGQLTGRMTDSARALEPALEAVQQAIADVRDMATDLRPPGLDDLGFVATLRALLRDWGEQRPHIQLHTVVTLGESDVLPRLGIILYRIIDDVGQRLAIDDTPCHLELQLTLNEGYLRLLLRWDVALDNPGAHAPGIAWDSVRELVVLSGGTFLVDETSGTSGSLSASWPQVTGPVVAPAP